MPPKRTRGGAAKASSSRKPPAETPTKEPGAQATAGAAQVDVQDARALANEQTELSQDKIDDGVSVAATIASLDAAPRPESASASRSGPAPRSTQPAHGKKTLQPKFTSRRNKDAREALARAEQAKNEQWEHQRKLKGAEDARLAGRNWSRNQRQMRARGRGGHMGDQNRFQQSIGIFAAPAAEGARQRPMGFRKAGVHRLSRVRKGKQVKREGEAATDVVHTVRESGEDGDVEVVEVGPIYISSDDDDPAPKKDVSEIDRVDLVTDDEAGGDEEDIERKVVRKYGVQPVRIRRNPARDDPELIARGKTRKLVQNDGDELIIVPAQRRAKPRAKDVEVVQSTRRWRGVYDDEADGIQVKDEPMEEVGIAVDEPLQTVTPDGPQKAQRERKKTHKRPDILPQQMDLLTIEEREEWHRHQAAIATLQTELENIDHDGDVVMDAQERRADNVYLFEFPSVLPILKSASDVTKPEHDDMPIEIEAPEPVPASPTTKKGKGTLKEKSQAKGQEQPPTVIKVEDGADLPAEKKDGPSKFSSGAMGKLRIHVSGKVTLDWGGTSMQVDLGLRHTFHEDVVITKLPEPGVIGEEGEAMALGPVRGEFTVSPDFNEIFGKGF